VTCRRWNWRQARRTALREGTTSALFIFDALDPVDEASLHAAADHLVAHLGPDARSARRLITAAG
jgi:DNA/RNA-binding domain of Phe-tRNA-synthetase-like protein